MKYYNIASLTLWVEAKATQFWKLAKNVTVSTTDDGCVPKGLIFQ